MNLFIKLLAASQIDISPLPRVQSGDSQIQAILSIIFAIAGGLALLVITLAGLRYVLSAGDAQKVAQAKNAIIYALVGLVVAIVGEVIVTFVLGSI